MRHVALITPFLLLCSALGACDRVDDQCEAIDFGLRSAVANGSHLQGRYLNGISIQGKWLNGISVQGRWLNGISLQGKFLNGVRMQSRYINGHFLNGIDMNGRFLNGIDMNGTELLGLDAEGNVQWRGDDFVGATLPGITDAGEVITLEIADVEPHATRTDIVYYALTLGGHNICGEGGRGLFVQGVWDETGARHDEGEDGFSFSYSCTTGVIAKCVEWGYTPYGVGTEAHQTCTRLARADYCGDGVSYTKDGTEIDVFDVVGVMRPEDDDSMRFEAGWGPNGAVCVDAPRYEMVLPNGDELLPPCWAALPQCATEAEAVEEGALLANRSHGDLRQVCGA